jgi:serine/threonine protein kinase
MLGDLGAAPQFGAKVCPTCRTGYPPDFNVCPRDGAALGLNDELVGKTLRDTFRIVRVIGEGGMGRVYEAQHTRIPNKRFAVKMLHPEYAREPQILARFLQEAEAAASIKSEYVVDVYDVDRTPDGRPFIVGELLEGREFADHLSRTGKMAVGPAVRIVRQVCKALTVAHAKGVIHRDMKPENVFLTGELERPLAKILDFGISKVESGPGGGNLTRTGMIMGTPAYMSPEQARGQRVDHRTDIYAVGAILYVALTGRKPFEHEDASAILMQVLTEDPPRPRSIAPEIPEPVEAIIQRAMAKNPDERPQSMAELDAALSLYDIEPPAAEGLARPRERKPSMVEIREHQRVSNARPMFLVVGSAGAFWAVGSILTMVVALMRLARGGYSTFTVTGSEVVLIFLGTLLVLAAPAFLLVRHLQQKFWSNTAKTVDLVERVVPPILAGLGAYGFGSLLVRFLETVMIRRALSMAWPVWDVLLALVGIAAAVGVYRSKGAPGA